MPAGTGRQTAAICDLCAPRIERKARHLLKILTLTCAGLSAGVLMGAAVFWTPMSLPDVYAVTPQGVSYYLPRISR